MNAIATEGVFYTWSLLSSGKKKPLSVKPQPSLFGAKTRTIFLVVLATLMLCTKFQMAVFTLFLNQLH